MEIRAHGSKHAVLAVLGEDLRFVLITSRATLIEVPGPDDEAIVVVPSGHKKCERCWHYRADVGADPARPEICARCIANLDGAGEPRVYA